MGEEDSEKKNRCKCLSKSSTMSMVIFVFFEVCCFQLCQVRLATNSRQMDAAHLTTTCVQVAATTLALEEFGAENIPYMYIAVAGANIIAVPILTHIGTRCVLLPMLPSVRASAVQLLAHSSVNSGRVLAQDVPKNGIVYERYGVTVPAWRIVGRPCTNATCTRHGTRRRRQRFG